jgi:GAF domain-containing protein
VTEPPPVPAAIAGGILAAHRAGDGLLQSIVEVARATFGAQACSIMVHEPDTQELEWVAVAGEGHGELEGRRVSAATGLAGWVRASAEPIVVDDVTRDPRFAREVAESTGYVPKGIMIAPLLGADENATGVINVLDRTPRPGATLSELELLGRFATQATLAVDVMRTARELDAALAGADPELAALARLAGVLYAGSGQRRKAATALLRALGDLLEG